METLEYVPFTSPRELSWLMRDLFKMYPSYQADSFTFEWLQRTPDLEVRCKDATGETVNFPTSPTLLDAIRDCKKISPKTDQSLPNDYDFSSFIEGAVSLIEDKALMTKPERFNGPLFDWIWVGWVVDYHRRITGSLFFQHRPDHWSCIMRDHSSPFDPIQEENRRDYILKSEIIAVTAIIYRQMNEMIYFPEKQKHGAKLRYKDGPLTATIVTFIPGKVRIVQATCNPSEKLPKLILTLRAIYNLGHDNYDKNEACKVIQWIVSPPEAQPAMKLAMRAKQ